MCIQLYKCARVSPCICWQISDRCQGKETCTFDPVNNSVFGDPCQGTFKYLQITFECVCPGGERTNDDSGACENATKNIQ